MQDGSCRFYLGRSAIFPPGGAEQDERRVFGRQIHGHRPAARRADDHIRPVPIIFSLGYADRLREVVVIKRWIQHSVAMLREKSRFDAAGNRTPAVEEENDHGAIVAITCRSGNGPATVIIALGPLNSSLDLMAEYLFPCNLGVVRTFVCGLIVTTCLSDPRSTVADEPGRTSRTLIPLKGERLSASLLAVSSAGDAVFATEKGERRWPLGDLVQWGSPAEPRSMVELVMADGGVIVLEDEMPTTSDDSFVAVTETFGTLKLPLRLLAGVMLHSPIDLQRRDRLVARLLEPTTEKSDTARNNRDWLFFENGDELQGRVTALTENGVEFAADVGPLTIERERLAAIAFDRSLRAQPSTAPRTLVGFEDGSVISAKSINLLDQDIELTLADGSQLSAGGAVPVYLQPLHGQVAYLSDFKPSGYRHIPYLNTPWEYRLDANVEGTRLRAGGAIYTKGVGMHSASRLTWQLDKPYRRFEAELAIDDQTENRGSVVFRVFAGSRELYKSPVIRGGDKPTPISLDIRDVRQLSLIVDYADRADVLDHADWLNARLVP